MNNNTNNNMGVNPQQTGLNNINPQAINNTPIPMPNQNQQAQPMPNMMPRPQQQMNNQQVAQPGHYNASQQPAMQPNMTIQPPQRQAINTPQMNMMPNNQPIPTRPMINPVNQQNPQQANLQPQPQAQPQQPQVVANAQPIQPQTAAPVQPVKQVAPQDIVINNSDSINPSSAVTPSVIEDTTKNSSSEIIDNSDVADITFDYNSIYGIPQDQNEVRASEEVEKPIFTAQEIVLENRDLEGRSADDVVPEFNINALDANTTESDSKLTDNVLNDRQQDRADTRRKILFIAVLVALLVISVGFIFPIISGNKF